MRCVDYGGHWGGEFRSRLRHGSQAFTLRESRAGTTSHAHFPGLMIPSSGSSENSGSCYGFHYGWSGGHRMVAEQLQDGRKQIQFGHTENSELSPGKSFETAKLYITHSGDGVGGVGRTLEPLYPTQLLIFQKILLGLFTITVGRRFILIITLKNSKR